MLVWDSQTCMFDAMKTMTTREFFHTPGIIKSLGPGQTVLVTDSGKPAVLVTRSGQRPRRSKADLDRENRIICPAATPKVNFTAVLRELKDR